MMRRLAFALLLYLCAAAARAQSGSMGLPVLTADPACSAGQYFIYYDSTATVIKMCQNGTITGIGTSGYTGTSAGVGGNQYDPDRPGGGTLVTNCSDEFDNGVSTGTWTSQNFGTSTITVAAGTDYAVLTTNQANSHARTCVLNNAAPWTMTVKMTAWANTGGSSFSGLIFPVGACNAGTQQGIAYGGNTNTPSWQVARVQALSGFGAFASAQATSDNNNTGMTNTTTGLTVCLQARYTPATKVMVFRTSTDCRTWNSTASNQTFASDPACGGFFTTSSAAISTRVYVHWIRTRTDSDATSGEFVVGQ